MLLSTTISGVNNHFDDENAIKLVAQAGFDAYDMSFCAMDRQNDHPMNCDNYLEYVYRIRYVAQQNNIICNQAHAPFHSSYGDIQKDEMRFKQIVRSVEAASFLGAKIIVVHPKQHLKYSENIEELKNININFYRSLIPYCEKYNIKIAVENMWQFGDGRIIDSTCSKAEEFCDYIDSIGSEWIVACLDVGHVVLTGENITKIITMLGNRLQALHIHDNDLIHDSHTMPYMMKMDFNEITTALSNIEYQGDITFEADGYFSKLPKSLVKSSLVYLRDIGLDLKQQIDKRQGTGLRLDND